MPKTRSRFAVPLASLLFAGTALTGLGGCVSTKTTTNNKPAHLLLMGGGSEPKNNQISLEKNMLYFQRVQDQLGLGSATRNVIFACGKKSDENDIQFVDPVSDDADTLLLIDALLGMGKTKPKAYRPNQVAANEGEASPEHIIEWFDKEATLSAPDQPVMVYFTGHGARGAKDDVQNTGLHLWPKQLMRVPQFTEQLDKLDPEAPVVLVMVQCFSGGFANVIFNEGDPAKGLSEHNRCGFFASVHDRTAAGCTAHVNEADYKEYSSYFWAALAGEDRLGVAVDRPDYNGDGVTCYLEAHAYAMIQSDSTDLSMCTTDRLVCGLDVSVPEGEAGVLQQGSAYSELLAAADPIRHAILEGLSERMGLTGEDRAAQAKAIVDQYNGKQKAIQDKQRDILRAMSQDRRGFVPKLHERWPELKDTKSPEAIQAVINNASAILDMIESEASFIAFKAKVDEVQALNQQKEALVSEKAHAERFLYTCESVAKISALLRFGKPAYFKAYYDLLEREMASPGV